MGNFTWRHWESLQAAIAQLLRSISQNQVRLERTTKIICPTTNPSPACPVSSGKGWKLAWSSSSSSMRSSFIHTSWCSLKLSTVLRLLHLYSSYSGPRAAHLHTNLLNRHCSPTSALISVRCHSQQWTMMHYNFQVPKARRAFLDIISRK